MQERYIKLLYCFFALIFSIILVYIIKLYFTPFFIILIIILFASPIFNFLNKFNFLGKQVNSLLSILVVNMLFFTILFRIGYLIANNLTAFVKNDFMNLYSNIASFISQNKDVFSVDLNEINLKLRQNYFNLLDNGFIKRGAVYTTEGIFAYLIGNITAYFILVDSDTMMNWLKPFVPQRGIVKIKNNVNNLKNIFFLELLLVMCTTVQTIFGFAALGIKNPISLGFTCGLLDVLPYVGTIVVFIFLIARSVWQGQYIIVIGLAALYILLAINRQILETKFMSKKFHIHPMLIVISMYISVKIFGIIGIVVGPLYVVVAKEILTY